MSNLNFSQNSQKIANLRAISPCERYSVKFLTKKASQPLRNLVIFSKNGIQKHWFQIQKHEKYLKFKNDIKRRLGAFNQELRANFEFWEFGNFRPISPWENGSLLMEKGFSALQKRWEVFIVMRTLHTALHNLCNIDHVYMYLDI